MKNKTLTVFVETPKGSRYKYKYDQATRLLKADKLLPTGMTFPCDFGFIPGTLAEDGDPLDIMLINEEPVITPCIIDCKVVGVMEASQTEKGKTIRNDRIIGIPEATRQFKGISVANDLPKGLINEIEFFFITYHHYNNVKFKILKIRSADRAVKLIEKAKNGNA